MLPVVLFLRTVVHICTITVRRVSGREWMDSLTVALLKANSRWQQFTKTQKAQIPRVKLFSSDVTDLRCLQACAERLEKLEGRCCRILIVIILKPFSSISGQETSLCPSINVQMKCPVSKDNCYCWKCITYLSRNEEGNSFPLAEYRPSAFL